MERVESGLSVGPLEIIGVSTKNGKSVLMDDVVYDEVARINPVGVLSEFEQDLQGAIVAWWMLQPNTSMTYGMDMADIAKLFWNERLNK